MLTYTLLKFCQSEDQPHTLTSISTIYSLLCLVPWKRLLRTGPTCKSNIFWIYSHIINFKILLIWERHAFVQSLGPPVHTDCCQIINGKRERKKWHEVSDFYLISCPWKNKKQINVLARLKCERSFEFFLHQFLFFIHLHFFSLSYIVIPLWCICFVN